MFFVIFLIALFTAIILCTYVGALDLFGFFLDKFSRKEQPQEVDCTPGMQESHWSMSTLSVRDVADNLLLVWHKPGCARAKLVSLDASEPTVAFDIPNRDTEPEAVEAAIEQARTELIRRLIQGAAPAASLSESTAPAKSPSVTRGVLVKSGLLPKPQPGGGEIQVFGLVVRTEEGEEKHLWGRDLQQGLARCGAKVGDAIEVIKLGRTRLEEGKAPMNLYTVTKIEWPLEISA
jgi:hypothetical protein